MGLRTLPLPRFALDMLTVRLAVAERNQMEALAEDLNRELLAAPATHS